MYKNHLIVVLLAMAAIFQIACQSTSTKEQEIKLKEKELELRERELKQKENNVNNNSTIPNENLKPSFQPSPEPKTAKYVYVVFKVREPKLHHSDAKYGQSGFDKYTPTIPATPEINFVTFENHLYAGEVQEIADYNEDKKYEYMDIMESNFREKLSGDFELGVMQNVSDKEEREQLLRENKTKIIDRKIEVFNSYKEASIHKNNNKGRF
jgi:hypothetical protein